jgi:hypothetical protein
MTGTPNNTVPPRFDHILRAARECLEEEKQRRIKDGLTRRHVADVELYRHHADAQFAKLLRVGPAQSAKLRND